jgi:hypothetical protein
MLKQIVPVSALAVSLGLLGAGCAAQVEDPADQSTTDQAVVADEAKSTAMATNDEERTGETQQAWWGGFGRFGFGFPGFGFGFPGFGFGGFGFPGFGFGGFGFPGLWGGWGGLGWGGWGGWGGFGGCGLATPFWGGWGGCI